MDFGMWLGKLSFFWGNQDLLQGLQLGREFALAGGIIVRAEKEGRDVGALLPGHLARPVRRHLLAGVLHQYTHGLAVPVIQEVIRHERWRILAAPERFTVTARAQRIVRF